jgi:hypothetical protein
MLLSQIMSGNKFGNSSFFDKRSANKSANRIWKNPKSVRLSPVKKEKGDFIGIHKPIERSII